MQCRTQQLTVRPAWDAAPEAAEASTHPDSLLESQAPSSEGQNTLAVYTASSYPHSTSATLAALLRARCLWSTCSSSSPSLLQP